MECGQTSFHRSGHLNEKEITVSMFNRVYTYEITKFCKDPMHKFGEGGVLLKTCKVIGQTFVYHIPGQANETPGLASGAKPDSPPAARLSSQQHRDSLAASDPD